MKKITTLLLVLFSYLSAFSQSEVVKFDQSMPETYVLATLSKMQLKEFSRQFSIDKVSDNQDGTFDVCLCIGRQEVESFLSKEVPFSLRPIQFHIVRMAESYDQLVAAWNRYPTYSTYLATMDTFQKQFPNLCEIDTILSNTPQNHKILAAHISNDLCNSGNKPAFFYSSTMHGDEAVGYYLMLHLIHYLLHNYDTDEQVKRLVDSVNIWICPLENPDGTYHTNDSVLNASPISTRYNANGVDLNRSYPPIVGRPATSARQPEIRAMIDFSADKHFTMSANFHGGSELFNYPWDIWETIQNAHADQAWWDRVGRAFVDTCHTLAPNYLTQMNNGVTEGGDWYVIIGSRQDYFNYYLGCREATIELGYHKVVPSNHLPRYWEYTRRSLLNYMGESLHGVRGIVTDSLTGQPLEAMIFVENHDQDNSQVYSHLPMGSYHRPIKGGTYRFTAAATGYQSKTKTITVEDGQSVVWDVQLIPSGTSVSDKGGNDITVSPNPSNGHVSIRSRHNNLCEVSLLDVCGHLLKTLSAEGQMLYCDFSDCPPGVYFVCVRTTVGTFTEKIVLR